MAWVTGKNPGDRTEYELFTPLRVISLEIVCPTLVRLRQTLTCGLQASVCRDHTDSLIPALGFENNMLKQRKGVPIRHSYPYSPHACGLQLSSSRSPHLCCATSTLRSIAGGLSTWFNLNIQEIIKVVLTHVRIHTLYVRIAQGWYKFAQTRLPTQL
jgi:hypothetical protein